MTSSNERPRLNHGSVSLWASALVILALVVVQAGRVDSGGRALADVATVGDLVLLNANAAGGEDVLIVLDGRAERVFVYGLVNRGVEMHVTENLQEIFARAKEASSGGR